MILKSVYGYALAFVFSILVYLILSKKLESVVSLDKLDKHKRKHYWLVANGFQLGFCWYSRW